MFLVDSHCHPDSLNYENYHKNPGDMLEKASARDVKFILAVATTFSSYRKNLGLLKEYENVVYSCGVHPLNIHDEPWDCEVFRTLASDRAVVALGETGLDYHYESETKAQQKAAFRTHIRLGCELNKPVIIHMREATTDTLSILREENVQRCGAVLHCFTEDRTTAIKLLDMGLYLSFSGILTFRNADAIREAARVVPLDRLLLETDSPYLSPVPHRGKENQPAYVRDVAEYLAVLKGVDLETLAHATTQNFSTLFQVSLTHFE